MKEDKSDHLDRLKKCKWKFQIFIYITIELNKSRNTVVRALFIGKRVSHTTFFSTPEFVSKIK
jgi:hypothetical protein